MKIAKRWTEEQEAAMIDYASWLDASTQTAIGQDAAPTDMSIRAETLRALYRADVLSETTPTRLDYAVATLNDLHGYATPNGKLGR